MKLPNAQNAVVNIAKLRDYSLNPNHPEGKHKARAFREKLRIRRDDAELLRGLILEAVLAAEGSNRCQRRTDEDLWWTLNGIDGMGSSNTKPLFVQHGSLGIIRTFHA